MVIEKIKNLTASHTKGIKGVKIFDSILLVIWNLCGLKWTMASGCNIFTLLGCQIILNIIMFKIYKHDDNSLKYIGIYMFLMYVIWSN